MILAFRVSFFLQIVAILSFRYVRRYIPLLQKEKDVKYDKTMVAYSRKLLSIDRFLRLYVYTYNLRRNLNKQFYGRQF